MKEYRLLDLLCSPTLISEHDTLEQLKRAACVYDDDCEGDWFPMYAHLENGKWVKKNLHF